MNAISFEAVKIALKQDKNGYVLTLAIHPNEVPDSLLRSWVGQRYGVALVPLDDELDAKADEQKGIKVFRLFGALCRTPLFQEWVRSKNWGRGADTEDKVRTAIKAKILVDSSNDVKDNSQARERFLALVREYDDYKAQAG